MNTLLFRRSAITVALGLLTVLSFGCVADGGGYGYDGGPVVGLDYYEPYGYDYGGWGPGYGVAPYRDGGRESGRGGGGSSSHAYRAAPASHGMPSIPSGSRSGGSGGRGGGGRR